MYIYTHTDQILYQYIKGPNSTLKMLILFSVKSTHLCSFSCSEKFFFKKCSLRGPPFIKIACCNRTDKNHMPLLFFSHLLPK